MRKYLKTTWSDVRHAERRDHNRYGCDSAMGRSSALIDCPFCNHTSVVYFWSLSGCGKRCSQCGAMHTAGGWSFRKRESEVTHDNGTPND